MMGGMGWRKLFWGLLEQYRALASFGALEWAACSSLGSLPSAKDFVAFIRFEGDPWIFEACVESQTGLGWEGP